MKLDPNEMVIFLDFDGVLHRKCVDTFELIPNFIKVLDLYPKVEVVISSNWRLGMSNEAYFKIFGKYVDRIIGQTPNINPENRELEILEFVNMHKIDKFIAIDDDCRGTLFSQSCEWLFKTDYYRGLDSETTVKLIEFINERAR